MNEIEFIEEQPNNDKCSGNGLVFKCYVNTYLSSHNSIEQRKSLRLLKTKSCKCEKCTWPIWDDFLSEEISCNDNLIDNLENGKIYKLIISSSYDEWNGGYDIDEVYFREVINEDRNTIKKRNPNVRAAIRKI